MAICAICKAEMPANELFKHQWTEHRAERLARQTGPRPPHETPREETKPSPTTSTPQSAPSPPSAPPSAPPPPKKGKRAASDEPTLPDMEADFLQLVRDLNIKNPESIAKYVAETGDLNDVSHVASALAETDVSDTKRRQMIKVWAKKRGRTLTEEELHRISGQSSAAYGGHSQGPEQAPFVQDDEGNWAINPKAPVKIETMLAFEAYRNLKERGQPADPFDLMADQANKWEAVKKALGLAPDKQEGTADMLTKVVSAIKDMKEIVTPAAPPTPSGSSVTEVVSAFKAMAELLAPGKGELKELKDKLEDVGKKPGTDPLVDALMKTVESLRDELAKKEREGLMKTLEMQQSQLLALRDEILALRQTSQAKGELDIMSQVVTTLDKRAAAMEGVVRSVFMRPPTPFPPEERQALTSGIAEEVAKDGRLRELGDRLFFHKP